MRDQRAEALAQILVRYSTKVQEGDVVRRSRAPRPPSRCVQAVYEEVLRAGGLPIVQLTPDGRRAAFYELASDDQLDWVPPPARVGGRERRRAHRDHGRRQPARALAGRPEEAGARPEGAQAADGDHRCSAPPRASTAGRSRCSPRTRTRARPACRSAQYEDFYYSACLATDDDPVTAWERQSDEVKRLAEWIEGKEEVHITAPGHRHQARTWPGARGSRASGEHNMPDGEFFTGPVEDSVEGEVSFSFPATYGGREVAGVRFRFEGGKVVDASAERGEEFLIEMLDTDDGARRLGELGIGTNYGIATGTKEILLDEKIGGTVHMAIGHELPGDRRRRTSSAVHWDMVCDLRQGGSITVDGKELQRDGKFVV